MQVYERTGMQLLRNCQQIQAPVVPVGRQVEQHVDMQSRTAQSQRRMILLLLLQLQSVVHTGGASRAPGGAACPRPGPCAPLTAACRARWSARRWTP